MFNFKFISLLLSLFLKVASCYYYVPVQVDPWRNNKTPLDLMVDVTNRFGLRILYEHNFLNANNIAFSPYGLTGIMIALYEGVNGESSYQIQQCLSLPWENDLVRVGFRDIHRTLKTYFIPEEGFLAGLALNNENVTLKQQYINTLKFYGFDFESGLGTTMSSVSDSTFSTQITTLASQKEETTIKTVMENSNILETKDEQPPMTTSKGEESTGDKTEAAVTEMSPKSEITTQLTSSTTSVSLAPTEHEESTTASEIGPNLSADDKSESELSSTTTILTGIEQSADDIMPTALPLTMASFMSTTVNMDTMSLPDTTILSPNQESPVTNPEITTSMYVPTSSRISDTMTSALERNVSTTSAYATTTIEVAETTTTMNIATSAIEDIVTPVDKDTPNAPSDDIETTTPSKTERKKRSLIEYVFQPTEHVEEIVVERPHFLYSTRQTTNYNIFSENMFLVDGLRQVEVTYMTYNSILDYAYLPHLKASALKLPLDSDQYYLLIILPDFHFDLNDLIKVLAQESDLREVYSALRSTYVQACVPSFMVKGYVSLTNDLQRLGIRNVFEPRQNDFSLMSEKDGVYVRNIEQSITVTIRKYDTKQMLRRIVPTVLPVRFSATYPFLYVVMDSKLHVSLMVGKMVDPLNSRIL